MIRHVRMIAAMSALTLGASAVFAADGGARWLSAADAPVAGEIEKKLERAADGVSWFVTTFTNAASVKSARWTVAGLGVFEVYVNGRRIGEDFLKPGFTDPKKTKYSFTYDVTAELNAGRGAVNALAAEVSSGWWRDRVNDYVGIRSAFYGVLELTYSDGSTARIVTNEKDWRAGVGGPVTHAGIYDGEEYDARIPRPFDGTGLGKPLVNDEFKGEILPSVGAEVCLREDLAIRRDGFSLKKGETRIVDFGQNCAAVPRFRFRAKRGTKLTVLFGEMLNDADKGVRGSDGPKGSLYRANLRIPDSGMRITYAFEGEGTEEYLPRHTFFGYRYASLSATDDVEVESIESVPVSSVTRKMEVGSIVTGDASVNRLISNVYWGQLSNYLSVPTDCPQRNERLGWAADTQVFVEAGCFNADVVRFFRKWMRDMRDCAAESGAFQATAPLGLLGPQPLKIGWADAGIIVPYTVWKQFGDNGIVRESWNAMERFVGCVARTRYAYEALARESSCQYADSQTFNGEVNCQYADWLSFEDYESRSGRVYETGPDGKRRFRKETLLYWDYLGGCYWLWDARMMATLAGGIGETAAREKYDRMSEEALAYLRSRFVDSSDGLLVAPLRKLQTAMLFALKLGVLERAGAVGETKAALRRSIADRGGCLATGFLGTSIIMDTLTENGMADVANDLLLNHKCPSWLYSVDQGATTIWERWNSYTKKDGFGPVDMNSFNHYAYGAVLAWIYKSVAGIAADPSAPGFRNVVMAPHPDRRLGFVKAEYKSASGLIKSAWHYEGSKWIWDFELPDGVTASVVIPGEDSSREYAAGSHHVER